MLVETGVDKSIAKAAQTSHIPAVLLAWLTAVAIHFATGSATVTTVTAAGLMAPFPITWVGGAAPSLVVLAIGAGTLFFSLNDAAI